MPTRTDGFLTVAQAADELNISPRAVRHRILTGSLAAEKFGAGGTSPYMIERAEVARVKAGAPA